AASPRTADARTRGHPAAGPRTGLPPRRVAPRTHTPQSACREYHGESSGHGERHQRPDEKEASGRPGNGRSESIVPVNNWHGERDEPAEEHDDVPRSPLGEQQRSACHEEHYRRRDEDHPRPALIQPEGHVAGDVKWQEYDG